jgi:anti-sigma regulatory factor (Ser/Thr protein kinase)
MTGEDMQQTSGTGRATPAGDDQPAHPRKGELASLTAASLTAAGLQVTVPDTTACPKGGHHRVKVTTPAHRAHMPRFTPAPPPVPRDPAAPDHRGTDRWPLRSYLELAALDTAPGSARAHAGAVLWEWNLSTISDECTLIVSELMTNAVFATQAAHCPEPVRMWMLGSAGASVLILIWDATAPAPVRRVTTPDAEHGRGLDIVDALSARWGTYRPDGHAGGKVVWAAMHAGDADP